LNFVDLYRRLDQTQSTNDKLAALVDFFARADAREVAWAVALVLGQLPPRRITTRDLKALALRRAAVPEWLFEESHASVGDLAETIALLVESPAPAPFDGLIADFIEAEILPAADLTAPLESAWNRWDAFSLFVLHKLLTGALRVGVAKGLLVRAMAAAWSLPEVQVAQGLMAGWAPVAASVEALRTGAAVASAWSSPMPFQLASALEGAPDALGPLDDWQVEWKWDGIRAQWVLREGQIALWSRGEELITERFPELTNPALAAGLARAHATAVLDGEVLGWRDDRPLPFQDLQTRIGRKTLNAKVLAACPARFLAYDLLELDGEDLRPLPLAERRARLEAWVDAVHPSHPALDRSPVIAAASWAELAALRASSRERGVEGLMVKRRAAPYLHGRRRGDWWKWKVDPLTLDAVLVYAQAGRGKRSNLFTDYTFAVLDADGALVPVAKAYSGLDQKEIESLDRWIRAHTKERFGPVRSVEPVQVFELAFEGIGPSPRHRAGVALRFPRILRWRHDKPAAEVDRLPDLRARFLPGAPA
jgi:DNA ligase-1